MSLLDIFHDKLMAELATNERFVKSEQASVKTSEQFGQCCAKAKEKYLILHKKQTNLELELSHLKTDTKVREALEEEMNVDLIRKKTQVKNLRKTLKKTEKQLENDWVLSHKDNMVLVKRRISLVITKLVFGIHLQDLSTDLTVYSWNKENNKRSIKALTFIKTEDDPQKIQEKLWNIIAQQESTQWTDIFKKTQRVY